tara:strand:- start:72 stop:266 length:195 start_codon:yes stop_codon:yes gene_type:complete
MTICEALQRSGIRKETLTTEIGVQLIKKMIALLLLGTVLLVSGCAEGGGLDPNNPIVETIFKKR